MEKRILTLALVLLVSVCSQAQTPGTDSLHDFVNAYEATWQAHDATRLAEYFAEDADMIGGIMPRIVGKAAIEAWWDKYFSRIDDGRVLSIDIESVRYLSPDIALINVLTTTGGTHSESNDVLESRKARGTWIVKRVDGVWKIVALRMHSPVGEQRVAPGRDD